MYKRRKYIVDSGFQWKFVFCFVAIALIGNLLATVVFNYTAIQRLEALRWSVMFRAQSTGEILSNLFMCVNLFNLLFVSVLLVITGVWMLNKMNGPIYGISKVLAQIREGNFSASIFLRKKDEFRDVADELNNMIDQTKQRFSRFSIEYSKLSQTLTELNTSHVNRDSINNEVEKITLMIQDLRGASLESVFQKENE